MRRSAAPLAGLALVLGFASLGTVEDYLGTWAAVGYLAAVVVAVPVAVPLVSRLLAALDDRAVAVLVALTFVAMVVAFALVFPEADTEVPGRGSDRDEDADLGASRLVRGDDPYDAVTYLGNPITHMPGSLLLAAPFVLLWTSALQNLFWLPVFFLALTRALRSARDALLAVWTAAVASPAVIREFLTGGDLIANAVYVLVLSLAVVAVASSPRRWLGFAAAAALGVALSSRANFVFVLPVVLSLLSQTVGWRHAARLVATSIASFALVTAPFYVADPGGFTPRRAMNKLSQFDDVLPHASTLVVAAAALTAVALSLRRLDRRGFRLAAGVAAVQLVFLVPVVVLDSLDKGRLDFSFLIPGYGVNAVFFAAFAAFGTVTSRLPN